MAFHWEIRRNGEGCDVFWRKGFTPQDWRTRLGEFLAEGLSRVEAEVELRLARASIRPGDVIVDRGTMPMCMEPAWS